MEIHLTVKAISPVKVIKNRKQYLHLFLEWTRNLVSHVQNSLWLCMSIRLGLLKLNLSRSVSKFFVGAINYRKIGVTSNSFNYIFWYSNSMVWFRSTIFSTNKQSMILSRKCLIESLLLVIVFEEKCL